MLSQAVSRVRGSALHGCLGALCVGFALLPSVLLPADAATPLEALRNARRVVFLGDSITYGGGLVADLAALMEREGMTADVINMGLSSETVSGL